MSSMTLSQFPLSFGTSLPPFLEPQYISAISPVMAENNPRKIHNADNHAKIPLSPSSSTGGFRVSKAKKGKRVHSCEWPGCEKVFTRAEHRRRHELSHKSKKTFVCAYDGCVKAFQRADYLAQHMARHQPDSTITIGPSTRTNSTSSTNSVRIHARSYSNGSPIMPGYHSPTSDTSPGARHQTEHNIASCFGCQNQTHTASDSDAPLFSYQAGEGNPANSNASLFPDESSASQLPSGLENAIDNYMRSVLRPEAFLTPGQPESHANSPFWNSNIDPSLPQIGASSFQAPNPSSYQWTAAPESLPSMPSTFQTAPHVLESPQRRESQAMD